ncbi:MAG: ATP-binding protein [Rhodothermales bacterium]|nr:ATP-binding protein [Rhodothermales bacterium]
MIIPDTQAAAPESPNGNASDEGAVLRALQEELRETRLLFGEMQRLVNLGTWSYYPSDGRIVWSDEVFRIAGFAREQGEPDFDGYLQRIHPEDAPMFLDVVQRALQCNEAYTIKHRLLLPDGQIRWTISSGRVLYDDQGQPVKLIGTLQDICKQEEISRATRDSEQRLRFHIEHSPLAYIEWGRNFNVVEWNPAAERMFGFTRDEVIGIIPGMFPVEEKEKVIALTRTLLAGQGGTYSVNTNQTKAGKRITCEWFNTTLRSADGQVVGVSSIVQDITQRIEAEQALMDYARELKKTRDQAESATLAKSAFLANMSHEIRTPLNGVIGMASLLSETELSSEQSDFVSTILVSSETLLGIINDVLDFSKIEAGKVELERLPVYVHDLIEGSLDLLATRAADHGLELLYELEPGIPKRIYTDPTRLRQILVNLLANGVKFTECGEIEVRVGAEERADGRYTLHFTVRDTGIGIPPEKVDRLFRSFSQVDASTNRKYGGTGLGLSISFRLAELMGGTMWVESVEGVGTTFHCTIVADALPGDTGEADRAFPVAQRILLLEPHPQSRAILSRRLVAMNLVVEPCASVAEAQSRILSARFDALIIDSRLTREEAGQLNTTLAASCVHVPVLAMVSLGGDSGNRTLPADVYLHRPVRVLGLFTKLQETFSKKPFTHLSAAAGLSVADTRVLVAEKHPLHQRLVLKMLGDLGCRVDVVRPADALAASAGGGSRLIVLGLDEIERAVATQPALRFDAGDAYVVALAMHLSAVRRSELQAIGVVDVLQLPLQAGALQRVVQRYMRSATSVLLAVGG